jgi:hypothetical protein
MSENNQVFENEMEFWVNKAKSMEESMEECQFKCCEGECNGNCEVIDPTTYCDYEKCDEPYCQCLDCELADIWKRIIRGESSKEFIDGWISMKVILVSNFKDEESDTVINLKKEIKALEFLREHQKE